MLLQTAALLLTAQAAAAQAPPSLVPGGSINGALGAERFAILAEDHPAARQQAAWIQKRFFADRSEILVGDACLEADLTGKNLIVYGTPAGHPWLERHKERLPFRFGEGTVELGAEHTGEHLRVLCCVKNPDDFSRRAVIYVAEHAADLADINGVFHGPTEYVVADGPRTLDSGSFVSNEALSPEAMAGDLKLLVEKLMTVHPRTAGGSWDSLDSAIQDARAALGQPMGRLEFWFTLMPIVAAFEDAHTTLGRPGGGGSFPLPLAWTQEGLVVEQDAGGLRAGDRVKSVGGVNEGELLGALAPLIPAENSHWRGVQTAQWLTDAGLLGALGLAAEGRLELVLERAGREIEVALSASRAAPPPGADAPQDWVRWSFHREGRVARFTLDRCLVDQYYLDRLDGFFREVAERGTQTIAVDLRENRGGNSGVCDEFLRYLPVDSYRNYSAAIRTSAASKFQRGDPAELGLKRYGPQVKRNDRQAKALLFDGDLVVLTSPRTFSSGVWFATVLKDNGLAKIVGEPTGGAPSAYGDILRFSLPASSLALFVSYKQWIRPGPAESDAITLLPDESIPRTAQDLATGWDPALAAILGESR